MNLVRNRNGKDSTNKEREKLVSFFRYLSTHLLANAKLDLSRSSIAQTQRSAKQMEQEKLSSRQESKKNKVTFAVKSTALKDAKWIQSAVNVATRGKIDDACSHITNRFREEFDRKLQCSHVGVVYRSEAGSYESFKCKKTSKDRIKVTPRTRDGVTAFCVKYLEPNLEFQIMPEVDSNVVYLYLPCDQFLVGKPTQRYDKAYAVTQVLLVATTVLFLIVVAAIIHPSRESPYSIVTARIREFWYNRR